MISLLRGILSKTPSTEIVRRKAAQLISQRRYYEASNLLTSKTTDKESLYLRLLLCHLLNDYEEEKNILDSDLSDLNGNPYISERRRWHELPLNERLVKRPPLLLPRVEADAPSEKTLNSLCIVSGASSSYCNHLIQLLESLQETSLYSSIPIGLLDCGLTDSERLYLEANFNITKIVKPDWKIPPPESIKILNTSTPVTEGHKAIQNKPFLGEYFPEFPYLMWLDADCWVHDERALDIFLLGAERSGIAATGFSDRPGSTIAATGVFALQRDSSVASLWREESLSLLETSGFTYGGEERSLISAMKKCGIAELLPANLMHRISVGGIPYVRDDTQILYSPETNKPLGIYAFDAHVDKSIVFWPTEKRNAPFASYREQKQHLRKSLHLLKKQSPSLSKKKVFRNQAIISLHFRTWPWQNKDKIRNMLEVESAKYV